MGNFAIALAEVSYYDGVSSLLLLPWFPAPAWMIQNVQLVAPLLFTDELRDVPRFRAPTLIIILATTQN